MPLVKGSNPKLGDNVVLEINASPGTAGISEVIKTNFINVLFNELTDPNEFMLQDKIAGFIETVNVNFGKVKKDFLAKLDTGNSTKASTLEVGDFTLNGNKIKFKVEGLLPQICSTVCQYSLSCVYWSQATTDQVETSRFFGSIISGILTPNSSKFFIK